ncbi:16S rRNA (cytosine(967)-C(5))-methyltransferase RsmB [Thermoflavimicrobium dichotomicum]|uniref:16S rRNA (cytosine(967)-C(5))-methyltransferase n=1 Tax=Thermoflavimicrobium dichotomicum TaxID=46223 RepID=A0A1I3SUK9_9BACL|nr:16S rRNA (cytosine(967)-C(5))-methyltransferase RsmB [Thermoflavimicrobium dichotomicum]SFJ61902.1 16S rRNA (cytosine967-C5)-methyltransferase [Thermoflavimicrobium dichotomicum]
MRRKPAREWALDILLQYEQNQSYSNLLLNQALQKSGLDARDKRLVTELVYGCIQRLNTLDWILNQLVKKGLSALKPWVRQALRLGLYQLMYLDRIPERAAVNETVHLAKKRGHQGIANLVNGVLRRYLREKEKWTFPASTDSTKELALAYSHPEWLVKRWVQVYGLETAIAMMQANLRPARVSVRVNRLKIDRDRFMALWREKEAGEVVPSDLSPDGVIIERGGNPAHSSLFAQGLCTIQDESSMLVARALAPKPGMRILDACAAPGGKSTHLAELMDNDGSVLACDIHPHKMELIRSNVNRLGIQMIETRQIDVRKLAEEPDKQGYFDAILLDAPCSGLGVIRRKPDIKWSKEAEEIDSLVQLQKELLESVAKLLRTGGVLLYSTCTIEPRENQEQVEQFLQAHPDFIPDRHLPDYLPPVVQQKSMTGEGWVQIFPHHFESDGFFIARLIKQA